MSLSTGAGILSWRETGTAPVLRDYLGESKYRGGHSQETT